jgi:hypothetical protein
VEGTGLKDVKIYVYLVGKIINVHELTLPLRYKHTEVVIFIGISRLLKALCENWRDKGLSVSPDGERSMFGSVRGVATRMENVAKLEFFVSGVGLRKSTSSCKGC